MTTPRFSQREWNEAIRTLRVICPVNNPVSVRRLDLPEGLYGDCVKRRGRFHIRIRRTADIHHSLMILTHEWAHAMVWPLYKDRDRDHPAYFGVAWSETYRAIFPTNA